MTETSPQWIGLKIPGMHHEAANGSEQFAEMLDNLSSLVDNIKAEYRKMSNGKVDKASSRAASKQSSSRRPSISTKEPEEIGHPRRPSYADVQIMIESAKKQDADEYKDADDADSDDVEFANVSSMKPEHDEEDPEENIPTRADSKYGSINANVGDSVMGKVDTTEIEGTKYRASHLLRSGTLTEDSMEWQEAWKELPKPKDSVSDSGGFSAASRTHSLTTKMLPRTSRSENGDEESQVCLVHPQATRKLIWDIMGLCLIGIEIIVLPLQLFTDSKKTLFFTMNIISMCYWSCDVALSFITAYYTSQGFLERRRSEIAKKYVKSWLAPDLLCIIVDVLSLFEQAVKSQAGVMRVIKIMKFVRLIRIFKVNGRMESSEGRVRSDVTLILLRLWKLMLLLFFTCHCLACGWWAVGKHYNRSDFNWIDNTGAFEVIGGIRDRSFGYRYSVCFHWALSQFVASSEVYPTNTAERAYAVLAASIALVGFGAMISGMTSSIVEITERYNKNTQKEVRLRLFLDQYDIPGKMRAKVWAFVKAAKKTRENFLHRGEVDMLQAIPKSMNHDLAVLIFMPIVSMHPMYEYCCMLCPRLMKKIAYTGLQEYSLNSGHEMFVVGEEAHDMIFVTRGSLQYNWMHIDTTSGSRRFASEMSEAPTARDSERSSTTWGDTKSSYRKVTLSLDSDYRWACELALYVKWKHTGIMEAPEHAEVVKLSAQKFCHIMRKERDVHMYCRFLIKYVEDNPDQQNDVIDVVNGVYGVYEQTRNFER